MVQVGERYRHYKSTDDSSYHTYEVTHVGIFQGSQAYDMEEVVVYKPLYTVEGLSDHVTVFVRPLVEFEGDENWQGKTVKRFTLIG